MIEMKFFGKTERRMEGRKGMSRIGSRKRMKFNVIKSSSGAFEIFHTATVKINVNLPTQIRNGHGFSALFTNDRN